MLAKEDKAGRAWCRENGYQGYTSYSSLDDLPQRATCFEQLVRVMKPHVEAFAGQLQMDLRGKRLKLDNIWVNVLDPGGSHTGHIHPHCVLSGTYYVKRARRRILAEVRRPPPAHDDVRPRPPRGRRR
jgi:uncharacterized protein (TIGR02466 family)